MKKILPIITVISGISLATLAITPYLSSNTTQTNILQHSKNQISENSPATPQVHSSISTSGNGDSIVVWEEEISNGSQINFKKIDFNGDTFEGSETCSPTTAFTSQIGDFINHRFPATAIDNNGNFIITWEAKHSENGIDILLQKFDRNCEPVDNLTIVNTERTENQTKPHIAFHPTNGDYIVTWESTINDSDIFLRRAQFDGSFLDGDDLRANDTTSGPQTHPRVAINANGDFIVVWNGQGQDDERGIYLQGYSSGGYATAKGNQLVNSFTDGIQRSPDITSIDQSGDFVITWDGSGNGDESGIFAKKVSRCNTDECLINTVEFKVNSTVNGAQTKPRISADYLGNYTIIWQSDLSTKSQLLLENFDHNDIRVGNEAILSEANKDRPYQAAISTADNGDLAISWTTDDNLSYRTFVSTIHKEDAEINSNPFTQNSQKQVASASTSDGNRSVVVWAGAGDPDLDQQGIYFTVYDHNGEVVNNLEGILANAYSQGPQSHPQVDIFNNGEFVICWDGEGPNDKQGIFYQYFRSDGSPQGPINSVNSTKEGPQLFCDIAADQNSVGDFIITWDGQTAEDIQGVGAVFYRSFSPSPEITVNEGTEGFQGEAQVAVSATGNAIIVWSEEDPFGVQRIKAQHYRELEEKILNNFTVSEHPDNQEFATAAFNDHDKFIIVWQETNQENQHIVGQYYQFEANANPTIIYSKFPISLNSNYLHRQPDIAMDNNGNFIATWTAHNAQNPSNPADIFYRVYSVVDELTPFGVPNRANSTINGQQTAPAITINKANSSFNINWVGAGKNDDYGINRQRFSSYFDINTTFFTAVSEQEIIAGGRTLSVPQIAYLEDLDVSFEAQENSIIFKNQDENAPAYFEVKDLLADENPYIISLAATDMFFNNEDKSYIPASSFSVRHNHESDFEIETIRGNSEDFILDESTHDFTSLEEPQILAEGNGRNFGVWRFLPEIKLSIPEMTPPGNHTGGLIFSLN